MEGAGIETGECCLGLSKQRRGFGTEGSRESENLGRGHTLVIYERFHFVNQVLL